MRKIKPASFKFHALSVAVALSIHASYATAQDSGAESLEEIIVTVQKKEERLQSVPVAVTAITRKMVETHNLDDIRDIANLTPAMTSAVGCCGKAMALNSMRGMTNIEVQSSADSPVGVYVDGVYIPRTMSIATPYAEIERVEVMRGPQGTLYGKNTTGGAMNIITKAPQDDFGGKIMHTFGTDGLAKDKLVVDTGRYNGLAARVSGMKLTSDGSIGNNWDDSNIDEQDQEAYSVAVDYTGTEDLYVRLTADKSVVDEAQPVLQLIDVRQNASAVLQSQGFPNFFADSIVAQMNNQVSTHRLDDILMAAPPVKNKQVTEGQALEIVKTINDNHKIKSISGYRSSELEFGGLDLTAGFASFPPFLPAYRESYINDGEDAGNSSDFYSQELQWLGTLPEYGISFVSGLYFSKEDMQEKSVMHYGMDLVNVLNIDNKMTADSQAVFGQATYRPDWDWSEGKLSITAGTRYTMEQKDIDKDTGPTIYNGGVGTTGSADESFSNISSTLIGQWDFDEKNMAYGKVSQGYKSGGFDASVGGTGILQMTPYDEETAITYEIGSKSDFLGGRARVNTALYMTSYDDMQVQQIVSQFNPSERITLNAGQVDIAGLEIDGSISVANGLVLSGGYAYTDVEFVSVEDKYGNGGVVGGDLSDQYAMPNVPENKYYAALDYSMDKTAFGRPTFNLTYTYRDEVSSVYWVGSPTLGDQDPYLEDVGLWSARASLVDIPVTPTSSAAVSLWVTNLTDEEYVNSKLIGTIGTGGLFGDERTIGLDLTYKF